MALLVFRFIFAFQTIPRPASRCKREDAAGDQGTNSLLISEPPHCCFGDDVAALDMTDQQLQLPSERAFAARQLTTEIAVLCRRRPFMGPLPAPRNSVVKKYLLLSDAVRTIPRGSRLWQTAEKAVTACEGQKVAFRLLDVGRMESEMVKVKYDDLSAAFDFVSFAAPSEHRAFLALDTGAIHWMSETNPLDEDDLPDDLETSDRYLAIPHKNDLDLGNALALRFVEERLPNRHADVEAFFRRRGAYARFKELLAAEGCLEKW